MERSAAVRYTYQDLLSLPESTGIRHEILDGKLYVTGTPRLNHQRVVGSFFRLMDPLTREHALGEVVLGSVTVHVHDELVFAPDHIFIRADHMGIVDPEGDVHGVPDVVVEVLSPGTRSYDRNLKRKHYMECGVPELWIVDAREKWIDVWRPGMETPEHVEDTLVWRVGDAAFDLPLAEIFRGV